MVCRVAGWPTPFLNATSTRSSVFSQKSIKRLTSRTGGAACFKIARAVVKLSSPRRQPSPKACIHERKLNYEVARNCTTYVLVFLYNVDRMYVKIPISYEC